MMPVGVSRCEKFVSDLLLRNEFFLPTGPIFCPVQGLIPTVNPIDPGSVEIASARFTPRYKAGIIAAGFLPLTETCV